MLLRTFWVLGKGFCITTTLSLEFIRLWFFFKICLIYFVPGYCSIYTLARLTSEKQLKISYQIAGALLISSNIQIISLRDPNPLNHSSQHLNSIATLQYLDISAPRPQARNSDRRNTNQISQSTSSSFQASPDKSRRLAIISSVWSIIYPHNCCHTAVLRSRRSHVGRVLVGWHSRQGVAESREEVLTVSLTP